jgi:hypothetical protein
VSPPQDYHPVVCETWDGKRSQKASHALISRGLTALSQFHTNQMLWSDQNRQENWQKSHVGKLACVHRNAKLDGQCK